MVDIFEQEFAVDYGGFVVGSGSGRAIHSLTINEESFEEATFNMEVDIFASGDTVSAVPFVAEITALFAAFRKPRQILTLRQQGVVVKTYDGFTGFDAEPRIRKSQDEMNTGRSGRYEISIRVGLPADNIGTSGRRNSQTDVQFSGARVKSVIFTGTYTATPPGKTARVNYDDNIEAFTTSILGLFGGSSAFKLAEEPQSNQNDTNKTLDFTRRFEQIIHTIGGASDASIRNEVITISRIKSGPGDTFGVGTNRLIRMLVGYSASLDQEASKDLVGKWEIIRESVIARVLTISGASALYVEEDNVTPNETANTLTGSMIIMAATELGVYEYTATTIRSVIAPNVFAGLWTGNPLAVHRYIGQSDIRFTLVETYKTFGGLLNTAFNPPGTTFPVTDVEAVTPKLRGIPDDNQLNSIEVVRTRVRRQVVLVAVGAGTTTTEDVTGAGTGGDDGDDDDGGGGGGTSVPNPLLPLGIGATGAIVAP